MKKRRLLRLAVFICFICLIGGFICSRSINIRSAQQTTEETESKVSSYDDVNPDLVSMIQEMSEEKLALAQQLTDSDNISSYLYLIKNSDGSRYYLQDITGDGIPELIVGDDQTYTVYSYSKKTTNALGTIEGQNLYYSDTDGIIAENEKNSNFILVSYAYSSGLLKKTVLYSSNNQEKYYIKTQALLDGSKALISFDIDDFSVFGS